MAAAVVVTKSDTWQVTNTGLMSSERTSNVIVIGGGPAGISTAIWCADLGLSCILLEGRPQLGGQLLWTYNPITNYPGIFARNGAELADLFARSIACERISIVKGAVVSSIDPTRATVEIAGTASYSADAIVVATGVRRRRLNIPGEDRFEGRGILSSGARDAESVAGKAVVIVGGGDAALENALLVGRYAEKVIVVHRRDEFTARAEFLNAAGELPNVELVTGSRVVEILGTEKVTGVSVDDDSGNVSSIACDAVLIRIGVEPNSEVVSDVVGTDDRGFVVVAADLSTSRENLWAAGDITGTPAMTIARAVGDGATAARSILDRLA
jgi:thioredoxin reductase (NADPH)